MILAFTVSNFLLVSCASILTGTKDRITFNSTPSGATIYKNGIEQCKTPCTLSVKRSLGDTDIEYKLDGYDTRLVTLDKEFNIISVINLGFLVGWGVDALTGSIMKYDKKTYDINLSKNNKTSSIYPFKINFDTVKNMADVYVIGDAVK